MKKSYWFCLLHCALVLLLLSFVGCSASDNAEIGDIITFGRYEQDNNLENGQEDILWRVLASKNDKLLVVSEMILDCKTYDDQQIFDIRYEDSYIRAWLADEFYDAVFTDEEKTRICDTPLKGSVWNTQKEYDTQSDTSDKVFLLSIEDVEKYFSGEDKLTSKATEYAKANGAYLLPANGNSAWWLRSPGYIGGFAAAVDHFGKLAEYPAYCIYLDADGKPVYNPYDENDYEYTEPSICGVRPAMWLNLK